jgi:colanic acid/amylovoran biosynthesis glycosyltransferase
MARTARLHVLEAVLRWPPETFLQWKIEALAERGVRVTVASTVPRRKARVRVRGAELKRVPHGREPAAVRILGAVRDASALLLRRPRRLARLVAAVRGPLPPSQEPTPWRTTLGLLPRYLPLARLEPDVVHIEWETVAGFYLPLMEVWDCPVVMSCRGREIHVYPHTPGSESWVGRLPAAFDKAVAVHCVSEAIMAEATRYGLDPAKACVIRPAVDTRFFRPAPNGPRPDSPLRVISVSDLFWVKGHEYALQAIRLLADRGVPVRFEVVGDVRPDLGAEPRDRERILGTIEDLGLHDEVELHGRLSPAGVRGRLQAADVLLHASLAEGIPNAALEAMACGVPVVATDCGGTREAVADGREGFVVPPREPRAMAAALEALWRDPDLRRRMGRAGRDRVESEFGLGEQAERVLALYRRVTAPRAKVAA